jgi:hypothetical protein
MRQSNALISAMQGVSCALSAGDAGLIGVPEALQAPRVHFGWGNRVGRARSAG